MKSIQKVWAEITAKKAEVALSKKKLQLSALDDVKEAQDLLEQGIAKADAFDNRMADVMQELERVSNAVFDVLGDAETEADALRDDYAKAEAALDEFQSLADDLGVDPADNADWANLESLISNDTTDAISKLDEYYNELDKIYRAIPS
jgi:DNA repair exonuclease SbcCD ATPase subunit